jgi:hypothetical protein
MLKNEETEHCADIGFLNLAFFKARRNFPVSTLEILNKIFEYWLITVKIITRTLSLD